MKISKKEILINSVKRVVELEKLSGVEEFCIAGRQVKKNTKKHKKKVSLEEYKNNISSCQKCPLGKTRISFVFGAGSPKAPLMFVGEAPGRDEDQQGEPFVGRAGQLLTKIIESIGLKREDVFIGNILKCRPPQNRNPLPTEISACTPYLLKQIDIIKPKVICSLGKFSAQTLLNSETPISRLRGKFYDYHGIKLMPTYHPAYLLRNQSGKKDVWEDMKAIAKELGLKLPQKK
ncbi:MAG: uracil-DNA glycosylase [Candidatus Omnitrophica bacterium]|nr:uracil-DNA glycosylase [Candidatus Omnitrophota bacterium]